MENKFGVRWQEFDRNDRITTKEKFLKTAEAREKFIEKLNDKNSFYQVIAFTEQ